MIKLYQQKKVAKKKASKENFAVFYLNKIQNSSSKQFISYISLSSNYPPASEYIHNIIIN